ncbi:Phospholipase D [Melia azedarach]|uniref:Phospholipase D n=1 Tax=Melia azedarach TaxID=155640 RepID=A0ACC1YIL6_MELAZ|nr:Phospholipase D [Melia azedarach]
MITSDPYVTVVVSQAMVARTRVVKNSQSPIWNEYFVIPLAHPLVDLEFQVKDNDLFGAEIIGSVKISTQKIATKELISGWFEVLCPSEKLPKPEITLNIELKFKPYKKNPVYWHSIVGNPEQQRVRHTYFSLRRGNQLKLYQESQVTLGLLHDIELDGGKVYRPGTCWKDICYAISETHHLIYIVGWSVFHKIKLIREPTKSLSRGSDLRIGELLKYKSEEGVRGLLLVLNDTTSHDKFGIKTMRTFCKSAF